MKRPFFYLLMLFVAATALPVNAQRTVIGLLADKETGKAVKNATITIRGTDVKTTSNSLGYFQLQVDSTATIEIDCPDYPAMEVELPKENKFKIQLSKLTPTDEPAQESYTIYEAPPSFPGGVQKFFGYISKNIKNPKEVKNGSVSGKVMVEFVVDSLGQIPPDKIKVTQGLSKSCDEEAIRLIMESPKWNPGIQKDKPVNILMHLPISFK